MKKRIEVNHGIHPLHFFRRGGRGRVKIFEKYLLGGVKKFYFVRGQGSGIVMGRVILLRGGSWNFEGKFKVA